MACFLADREDLR
uniref:Uncharacterized protein n=1 Tax=Arundo donax TaxID=35708 RepID=A0A0A9GZ21_ARUDO